MNKDRFEFIDALRGWAILGVIATHAASAVKLSGKMGKLAAFGGYGVQLFFMVSAFTIFLTYQKATERETYPNANFFTRRLMRIAPVYWLGILLYSAVYGLGSRGWLEGPEMWHLPLHFLLINLLHPATMSSVVPGGWSISCEVLFYLTVPLLFAWIKTTGAAAVFCAITAVLGPLSIAAMKALIGHWADGFGASYSYMYYYRSLPSQLFPFAVGILLFHVYRAQPAWLSVLKRRHVNFWLIVAGLLAFAISMFGWYPHIQRHHWASVGFLFFGLAASQIQWSAIVNKPMIFLGRISFSAYLLHFIVQRELTVWIPQGSMPTQAYFALVLVASIAITVPLAWLSFSLLEKNFQRAAGLIVQARENRAASPRSASTA
nr:acyltransferase [Variovorax boronicumulans]